MVWSSITSICDCPPNAAIYLNQTNYPFCITCNSSIYATRRSGIRNCSCIHPSFVWNGFRCLCPSGSIILSDAKCVVCPTKITIGNYSCNCITSRSMTSFWNDLSRKCVACGTSAVPYSLPISYGLACACKPGYIWDVMTNGCIPACKDDECNMNCAIIPFLQFGGNEALTAVPVSSVNVKNFTGGDVFSIMYKSSKSNYLQISDMACPCAAGFSWDVNRLRCVSDSLI